MWALLRLSTLFLKIRSARSPLTLSLCSVKISKSDFFRNPHFWAKSQFFFTKFSEKMWAFVTLLIFHNKPYESLVIPVNYERQISFQFLRRVRYFLFFLSDILLHRISQNPIFQDLKKIYLETGLSCDPVSRAF